jgi:hypothetical protein
MKKVLNIKISLVLMLFMFMAVFQFMGPTDRPNNLNKLSKVHVSQIAPDNATATLKTSGYQLTAGVCALLLVGYLFWSLIRKSHRDSQNEKIARDNSLYDLSLATGRTEYDLFHKSAEGWSVSADRIDQDFKRYMADQVMPHYAQDFVRKNREHVDESLIIPKEAKSTSWTDWAIALSVFPGSILFLYIIVMLFDQV